MKNKILVRIKKLKAMDDELGRVDFLEEIQAEKLSLEKYFLERLQNKKLTPKTLKEIIAIKNYLKLSA